MQLSSSNFPRTLGSTRRGAVSSSRDAAVFSETMTSHHPLGVDASPAALRKISGAQKGSAITSSEHNRTSSGRNTSNIKNLESTLRGIEGLSFNDERVQY